MRGVRRFERQRRRAARSAVLIDRALDQPGRRATVEIVRAVPAPQLINRRRKHGRGVTARLLARGAGAGRFSASPAAPRRGDRAARAGARWSLRMRAGAGSSRRARRARGRSRSAVRRRLLARPVGTEARAGAGSSRRARRARAARPRPGRRAGPATVRGDLGRVLSVRALDQAGRRVTVELVRAVPAPQLINRRRKHGWAFTARPAARAAPAPGVFRFHPLRPGEATGRHERERDGH